jgi:hypothetical protein
MMKNINKQGDSPRRKAIPLRPDYARALGGVLPALIFQQLEFLIGKRPENQDGIHKFVSPPTVKNEFFRPGESWVEELFCSPHQFSQAFNKIGVSYGGLVELRGRLDSGEDPFSGKLYLKVRDGLTNLTWFIRNHTVTDKFVEMIDSHGDEGLGSDRWSIPNNPVQRLFERAGGGLLGEEEVGHLEPAASEIDELNEEPSAQEAFEKDMWEAHADTKTGVWLQTKVEEDTHTLMVERFGVDRVQSAAREAAIQKGRAWISQVAAILTPPNERGRRLTPGKWGGFEQKDYMKGIKQDFSF